ncbi:MAG: hypothetical protein FWG39_03530 [Alphaproteobacteria bacterium]|nr:hypothetical protein [Alphaproteobacteria bacterium]
MSNRKTLEKAIEQFNIQIQKTVIRIRKIKQNALANEYIKAYDEENLAELYKILTKLETALHECIDALDILREKEAREKRQAKQRDLRIAALRKEKQFEQTFMASMPIDEDEGEEAYAQNKLFKELFCTNLIPVKAH